MANDKPRISRKNMLAEIDSSPTLKLGVVSNLILVKLDPGSISYQRAKQLLADDGVLVERLARVIQAIYSGELDVDLDKRQMVIDGQLVG